MRYMTTIEGAFEAMYLHYVKMRSVERQLILICMAEDVNIFELWLSALAQDEI